MASALTTEQRRVLDALTREGAYIYEWLYEDTPPRVVEPHGNARVRVVCPREMLQELKQLGYVRKGYHTIPGAIAINFMHNEYRLTETGHAALRQEG